MTGLANILVRGNTADGEPNHKPILAACEWNEAPGETQTQILASGYRLH
jgi:hypothetical protein